MYILECSDGSYYTGSTTDLDLRLEQHQNGEGANHTNKRLPVKLVYFEEYNRIDLAFYREKQVQGWSRKKKEALIRGEHEKLPELSMAYRDLKLASGINSLASRASANGTAIQPLAKAPDSLTEAPEGSDLDSNTLASRALANDLNTIPLPEAPEGSDLSHNTLASSASANETVPEPVPEALENNILESYPLPEALENYDFKSKPVPNPVPEARQNNILESNPVPEALEGTVSKTNQ